ncbi:MAG: PDZ domain-containing protein [Pirellulales bacterium]
MRNEHWQQHAMTLAIAAVVLGSGAIAQAQGEKRNAEKGVRVELVAEDDVEVELKLQEGKDGDRKKDEKSEEGTERREKRVRWIEKIEKKDGGTAESGHWIGLQCSPIDPALRAQLGLEKVGLLVDEVVPGSPAEKAGIQRHDVLTHAGDQALGSVEDLMGAVKKSQGKSLFIALVRGGKAQKFEVAPTRRDAKFEIELTPRVDKSDRDIILKWLDRDLPEGHGKVFMRRVMPGMMMGGGLPKLPKDVSVSITKTGAEPAKIVVKRGKEAWEINEKQLDRLPEELRGPVGGMIGQPMGMAAMRLDGDGQKWPEDMLRPAPRLDVRPLPPGVSPKLREAEGVEKKLEKLNERLDKLQKTLEQLREAQERHEKNNPTPGFEKQ